MNHRVLQRIAEDDFASVRHRRVVMEHGIHVGVNEPCNLRNLRLKLLGKHQVLGRFHSRIIIRENNPLQMQDELFELGNGGCIYHLVIRHLFI